MPSNDIFERVRKSVVFSHAVIVEWTVKRAMMFDFRKRVSQPG